MIRMFFRLPWFVFLGLSVLAVAVGFYSYTSAIKYNDFRDQALSGEMPDVIDSGDVTDSSFSDAEEINVGAQISDQIFTVSVSGRRTIDKEKTTIFAFSENATSISDPVNVVFMLDSDDSVESFIRKFATGENGRLSPILHVNGLSYLAGGKLEKVVEEAAIQGSIKLGPSVQFVAPFMEGREQDMKPRSPNENFSIFAGLGAILAVFSLFKFFRSRKTNT